MGNVCERSFPSTTKTVIPLEKWRTEDISLMEGPREGGREGGRERGRGSGREQGVRDLYIIHVYIYIRRQYTNQKQQSWKGRQWTTEVVIKCHITKHTNN